MENKDCGAKDCGRPQEVGEGVFVCNPDVMMTTSAMVGIEMVVRGLNEVSSTGRSSGLLLPIGEIECFERR